MGKVIVLVEDDSLIRQSLADILEFEGYRVETAANGELGLEIIRRLNGECVVVIDLQMPVMSGEQLMEALQAAGEPLSKTPVIAITACGGKLPALRVPVLKKPLQLDKLFALLNSAK